MELFLQSSNGQISTNRYLVLGSADTTSVLACWKICFVILAHLGRVDDTQAQNQKKEKAWIAGVRKWLMPSQISEL